MHPIKEISVALKNASPDAITAINAELAHLRGLEKSEQRLRGWGEARLWTSMFFNFIVVLAVLYAAIQTLSQKDAKTTAAIWAALGFALRSSIAGVQAVGAARKERAKEKAKVLAEPKGDST